MKFIITVIISAAMSGNSQAFTPLAAFGEVVGHPQALSSSTTTSSVFAIRPKTDKSDELRFGWDGTTALGMCYKEDDCLTRFTILTECTFVAPRSHRRSRRESQTFQNVKRDFGIRRNDSR
jgi:hypothetical protein